MCLAGSLGGFEATPQCCSLRGREGWSSPARPPSDVGCEDGARRDFISRTRWGVRFVALLAGSLVFA